MQAPVQGPAVRPAAPTVLLPVRPAAPPVDAGRARTERLADVLPVGAPVAGSAPRAGQTVRSTLGKAARRVAQAPAALARDVAPVLPGLRPDVAVPQALATVTERTLEQPVLPVGMVLVVVAFVLVQHRIDRRDPKLAQAPVEAEPMLVFRPTTA